MCSVVKEVVRDCVDNIELQQKLSLSELEAVFKTVLVRMKSVDEMENIFTNPGAYFLPSSDEFLENLADIDKDEVKKMLAETLDVIECEDSIDTAQKLCRWELTIHVLYNWCYVTPSFLPSQGLSHTLDSVGGHYTGPGPTKASLHHSDSGFVSPASVSLPLAKLIPILSSQVNTRAVNEPPRKT